MAELRIHLLGPPRVEIDGEPVHIGRRKALGLLAYVALAQAPCRREALAALLWPESDESSARADLRRTPTQLRSVLGAQHWAIDRETVALAPEAEVWVDAAAFRDLVRQWREHSHADAEACPTCLEALEEAADLRGAGCSHGQRRLLVWEARCATHLPWVRRTSIV